MENQYAYIVEKLPTGGETDWTGLFWDGKTWQRNESKAIRFDTEADAQELAEKIGGEACPLEILPDGRCFIPMG